MIAIRATPALRVSCAIAAAVMAIQVVFLAEPRFALAIVNATWDKFVHFTYFGTMAFFLWVAAGKRYDIAVWVIVIFVGAADETHQAYVPGRSSDIRDWLADGLGAAAALIVMQRATLRRVAFTGERPCVES